MVDTHDLRSSHLFQVRGYVCVVTGGGTGIGLMAAQALAANVRAKVYIVGRRREKLEAAAKAHTPGNGQIIPAGPYDVQKKEDLENLVKEIQSKETHINLLVTSAGTPGTKAEPSSSSAPELKAQLWQNESFEAWNSVYSADVTSVYFTTVAFLTLLQAEINPPPEKTAPTVDPANPPSRPHPHQDFSPSVITISSMSGVVRNAQGHFSYNAAKAATVQLTKIMSAEFSKAKIRVNSIAPGYFPSELTAKSSGSDSKSNLDPEYVRSKGHVPIERPGADEEMAQAVLFLAKCQYVTGQILEVEGGVRNVLPGG